MKGLLTGLALVGVIPFVAATGIEDDFHGVSLDACIYGTTADGADFEYQCGDMALHWRIWMAPDDRWHLTLEGDDGAYVGLGSGQSPSSPLVTYALLDGPLSHGLSPEVELGGDPFEGFGWVADAGSPVPTPGCRQCILRVRALETSTIIDYDQVAEDGSRYSFYTRAVFGPFLT